MTYEKLNLHYDMDAIFKKIERNMREGHVSPQRMRRWAEDCAREIVPQGVEKAEEFVKSIEEHCCRWIEYLEQNQTPPGTCSGFLPQAQVEQMRLKCDFAVNCKDGG